MTLDAMKAVYCYHFPEARPLLRQVEAALPPELYRVTAPAREIRARLLDLFDPPLYIPEVNGNVDLDELHLPVIERIVAAYAGPVPALGRFAHAYPTSGSSEGLFHILARFATEGVEEINVLRGEYEGYGAQARNLGMRVVERREGERCTPGVWFVSNPSARDGNLIEEPVIRRLCDDGHRVVYDLAYVGATRPHVFDLSHENVVGPEQPIRTSFRAVLAARACGRSSHRVAENRTPLPCPSGYRPNSRCGQGTECQKPESYQAIRRRVSGAP